MAPDRMDCAPMALALRVRLRRIELAFGSVRTEVQIHMSGAPDMKKPPQGRFL